MTNRVSHTFHNEKSCVRLISNADKITSRGKDKIFVRDLLHLNEEHFIFELNVNGNEPEVFSSHNLSLIVYL